MGEVKSRVSDSWGVLVAKLFEHKLVTFLADADAATLGGTEATAVVYQELRSFLALKSILKSSDPSEILQPAHEALLSYAARLFMVAHQTLLNGAQKEAEGKPAQGRANGEYKSLTATRQFLLEWQLVRLKSSRDRLIMELADVSEKNELPFRSLGLPEALCEEVESARLRISNVWKELAAVLRESSARREVGGHISA
jgi:hypothetical protein